MNTNEEKQENLQVQKAWIICDSKSRPGLKYFFNPYSGEAVWNISDAEVENAAQRTQQLQNQGTHLKYPEPRDPPSQTPSKMDPWNIPPLEDQQTCVENAAKRTQQLQIQGTHLEYPEPRGPPSQTPSKMDPWNIPPPIFSQQITNNQYPRQLPNVFHLWANAPQTPVVILPTYAPIGKLGNNVQINPHIKKKKKKKNPHINNGPNLAPTYINEPRWNNNNLNTWRNEYQNSRFVNQKWFTDRQNSTNRNDLRQRLGRKRTLSESNSHGNPRNDYYKLNIKHDNETYNNQEDEIPDATTLNISPLKQMSLAINSDIKQWFIVVDLDVITNFRLFNNLIGADPNCFIVVPHHVVEKLESQASDVSKRRILRFLTQHIECDQVSVGAVIQQPSISDASKIFKTCLNTVADDNYVILLSNDPEVQNYTRSDRNIKVMTTIEFKEVLLKGPVRSVKLPPSIMDIKIVVPNSQHNNTTLKNDTEINRNSKEKTETPDITEVVDLPGQNFIINLPKDNTSQRSMSDRPIEAKRREIRLNRSVSNQKTNTTVNSVETKQFKWRRRRFGIRNDSEPAKPPEDNIERNSGDVNCPEENRDESNTNNVSGADKDQNEIENEDVGVINVTPNIDSPNKVQSDNGPAKMGSVTSASPQKVQNAFEWPKVNSFVASPDKAQNTKFSFNGNSYEGVNFRVTVGSIKSVSPVKTHDANERIVVDPIKTDSPSKAQHSIKRAISFTDNTVKAQSANESPPPCSVTASGLDKPHTNDISNNIVNGSNKSNGTENFKPPNIKLSPIKKSTSTIRSRNKNMVMKSVKIFEIESDSMEEALRTRCDEWVSRFVQIMEEILRVKLHEDPPFHNDDLPPPWNLHEAARCIIKKYSDHFNVVDAANKLSFILFKISDEKGNVGMNVEPHEYIEMYSFGVNLVDTLMDVTSNCEELKQAADLLQTLLHDIRNANLDSSHNDTFVDEPHDLVVDEEKLSEAEETNASENPIKKPFKITEYNCLVSPVSKQSSIRSKYSLRSRKRITEIIENKAEIPEILNETQYFFDTLKLKSFSSDISKPKSKEFNFSPKRISSPSSTVTSSYSSTNKSSANKSSANNNSSITGSPMEPKETVDMNMITNSNKLNVSVKPTIVRNFIKFTEFEERLQNKYSMLNDLCDEHQDYGDYDDNYSEVYEDGTYGCDDTNIENEYYQEAGVRETNVTSENEDLNGENTEEYRMSFLLHVKNTFNAVSLFCEENTTDESDCLRLKNKAKDMLDCIHIILEQLEYISIKKNQNPCSQFPRDITTIVSDNTSSESRKNTDLLINQAYNLLKVLNVYIKEK